MSKTLRGALLLPLFLSVLRSGSAADDATTAPGSAIELAKLRTQLAEQQKQIEQLSAAVRAQQQMLERLAGSAPSRAAALGELASTAPMLPPPQSAPATAQETAAPLQLKLGETTIMPVGFMDLNSSFKDKNAGGSLSTNFGSIPFNNTAASKLSEFRFSAQNSRVGFRVDGNWKGAHFLGYNEFDFAGTSAANNLSVNNGAFVPRLRLFWASVRKGRFEFLGGQSWSLLTPNRRGMSAIPGDLFISQAIELNYVIGLAWSRQPGIRFLYRPSSKVTMGVSLENPDQYIGGSGGGPLVTLPAALPLGGSQLDNSTNVQTIPNLHPDVIAKVAVEPNSRVHFEFAGIERTFKIWNPGTRQYFTKPAGGAAFNGIFEFAKGVRYTTTNYWSDGGGRYLFGNAPDLVLRADGNISPIHSGGTVQGLEIDAARNLLLYGYWGGIYVGRNTAIDANGAPVGYGYTRSPSNHNRTVQEITVGFNRTLWRDPRYGAINLMGQYQYVVREPWYVAPGDPKSAHDNTVFLNFRYTLPGTAPAAR